MCIKRNYFQSLLCAFYLMTCLTKFGICCREKKLSCCIRIKEECSCVSLEFSRKRYPCGVELSYKVFTDPDLTFSVEPDVDLSEYTYFQIIGVATYTTDTFAKSHEKIIPLFYWIDIDELDVQSTRYTKFLQAYEEIGRSRRITITLSQMESLTDFPKYATYFLIKQNDLLHEELTTLPALSVTRDLLSLVGKSIPIATTHFKIAWSERSEEKELHEQRQTDKILAEIYSFQMTYKESHWMPESDELRAVHAENIAPAKLESVMKSAIEPLILSEGLLDEEE